HRGSIPGESEQWRYHRAGDYAAQCRGSTLREKCCLGFLPGGVFERAKRYLYALRSPRKSLSVLPKYSQRFERPELQHVRVPKHAEFGLIAGGYVGSTFPG